MRRYVLDASAARHGDVLIAGSPIRLFRLTEAGAQTLDALTAGSAVADSALVGRLLDAGAIHPRPEPNGRFSVDDVTVVVPTHGAAHHRPAGAIVVDDGSEPPVAGATIRLPGNRGPAAARNAGLELVDTPLVAFVDADVLLPAAWLGSLLGHFDDERVALVAPRVASSAGASTRARYEHTHSPLDLGNEPARIRPGTRVSYAPTAAVVCRADAVRSIGGFDEDLRFGEDVDLVWRLDRAGWRLRYEPAVVVEHPPRPSWPSWLRQRFAYGSSAAPLAKRHRGALAPIRMNGWSLVAWALALSGRPWLGIGIGAATTAALVPRLPHVPPAVSLRLAADGNLRAGKQIGAAVRRVWWPVLAVLATRSRWARRVIVWSVVAAGHPIRVVDDVAYSVGVWAGIVAERELGPAIPELRSWPGGASADGPRTWGRRWLGRRSAVSTSHYRAGP